MPECTARYSASLQPPQTFARITYAAFPKKFSLKVAAAECSPS